MDNIINSLIEQYCLLLDDLAIGYPLQKDRVKELMFYIHLLHYTSFVNSSDKELLNILTYYE
jgi:hypothetical protein